ncbi:LacI family DNA-binding transcriptional regulator [Sanguibacter antarcticus]|uniref:LacI family transcriptional regulator n=1 Tax=Sanguibacter antarcticus TaxID=372484 RepID=A0A2A9E8C9_9MICO|nr:LacI family DNA-binding transcriptional regulator [Sanguibacter antarcticus]PFG34565.1 LacI family transcriptional regulator [Sanguibacter antarcticus]
MVQGIEDVARAAGVSTATVSRALRGLPNVSAATRERVRSAALALGYVASPSAASLASGRMRTIGLLTPWVNRWFFANVIEGAERTLRAVGFDALLYTFDISREQPRREVDPGVLRRRVDGTLVVGMPLRDAEVQALEDLGQPLAFVGTGRDDHLTVRLDDHAAGTRATEHLVALGHRAIGHVSGTPDDHHSWSPPNARRAGWADALGAAGSPPLPGWEINGNFDVPGGRASTHTLLDAHPELTAVFAASDEMAMGVILAARDRGLRVPEDLSVIGIDGHDLGELVDLTTVSQDASGQGAQAAALLLELIAGGGSALQVIHPTRLVVRGSTGSPRSGDA